MIRAAFYWLYLRLRRVRIESCLCGACWCRGAKDCFFKRCRNCDSPIDAEGKTLDPEWADEHHSCPDCDGKLYN